MNWENIRIRYVEIGIPLFMLGTLIMAIGIIIDYLIIAIYEVSYPVVRYVAGIGMLMMCIGVMAFPLLFKWMDKE